MPYRIRVMEPAVETDAATLRRLWSENLPVSPLQLDTKLDWFYRDAPHGAGRAFTVVAGDSAVGCAGIGVRTFFDPVYGPRRVGVFADLAVDKHHRSAFPALVLVRAVRAEVQRDFALGYGFPNEKATAVYMRVGYEHLGEMPRYVRPLRYARLFRGRVGDRLATLAGGIVDRVAGALTRLAALPGRRGYELRVDMPLDDRFDELWREARDRNAFACERSAAFLRWRFAHERHVVLTLHARRTAELRAYAVVRAEPNGTLQIVDLFGLDHGERFALLAQLLRAAADAGAPSVTMRFLGDPRVTHVLARLGFLRRPDGRSIVVAPGTARHDGLRDPSRWYLTDLDEDN